MLLIVTVLSLGQLLKAFAATLLTLAPMVALLIFLLPLTALALIAVTLYVTSLYLIVAGMESSLIPAFALLKRTSEPTFVTVY